eukprot:SAG22_NODE_2528_length_2474_cov_2.136421_1_plen_133_part_00
MGGPGARELNLAAVGHPPRAIDFPTVRSQLPNTCCCHHAGGGPQLAANTQHWKTELLAEIQKPKALEYTVSNQPTPSPASVPARAQAQATPDGAGGAGKQPPPPANGLSPAYAARLSAALDEDSEDGSDAED